MQYRGRVRKFIMDKDIRSSVFGNFSLAKIFGLRYSEIFHERRSSVFGIRNFFKNEDLRSSVFGNFLWTKIFGLQYSEIFYERRSSVFGIWSKSLFGATLHCIAIDPQFLILNWKYLLLCFQAPSAEPGRGPRVGVWRLRRFVRKFPLQMVTANKIFKLPQLCLWWRRQLGWQTWGVAESERGEQWTIAIVTLLKMNHLAWYSWILASSG